MHSTRSGTQLCPLGDEWSQARSPEVPLRQTGQEAETQLCGASWHLHLSPQKHHSLLEQ